MSDSHVSYCAVSVRTQVRPSAVVISGRVPGQLHGMAGEGRTFTPKPDQLLMEQ